MDLKDVQSKSAYDLWRRVQIDSKKYYSSAFDTISVRDTDPLTLVGDLHLKILKDRIAAGDVKEVKGGVIIAVKTGYWEPYDHPARSQCGNTTYLNTWTNVCIVGGGIHSSVAMYYGDNWVATSSGRPNSWDPKTCSIYLLLPQDPPVTDTDHIA